MSNVAPLTEDFHSRPYWWDRAAPARLDPPELPSVVDVAIIGSGVTGLSAARLLLRAGRRVAIFDSEDPGFGASRRNAGYLGRTLKKSFPELAAAQGDDRALALYQELDGALQTVRSIIAEDRIDCHLEECGRFIGATSPAHYDKIACDLESTHQRLGFPYRMVARAEQHAEMATDLYFGGAVIPDLGALHPGLYHKGLLDRVVRAGGEVCGRTEVRRIGGDAGAFRLETAVGEVLSRDVIVATNGYTPRALGWHARRVIPFTAYMAATERLAPELLAKLLPRRRTVIDSNVNIDFVRLAPDSPRLLFGGATGSGMVHLPAIARRLQQIIGRIFPDLSRVRLSHVWTGRCAGTWDSMPHLGCHEGVWHAMGYNFAGVPLGTYFGVLIARRILHQVNAPSAFEHGRFPTFPFYTGNPWFVPFAMRWFDWKDRRFAAGRHGIPHGG